MKKYRRFVNLGAKIHVLKSGVVTLKVNESLKPAELFWRRFKDT